MGRDEKVGDIGSAKESTNKLRGGVLHRLLLATTAAVAVALGGGEVKGAEDPRPAAKKESREDKELSVVHHLRMFRFRGALYVVDPQDPEGNRVYRLEQGNRYDAIRGHPWNIDTIFNNCTARGGGTAEKPHNFAEPFIMSRGEESYAGQKRWVFRTYVSLKGGQLLEQGKPIQEKDVDWTFTRQWNGAPVAAADLMEATERMRENEERLRLGKIQLQTWTLIVRSVDDDGKGFTDHKGIEWKLTQGKPGSRVDKRDIGGTYRDALHNPTGKRLSIVDPFGREWTRDWEPPKKARK